MWWRRQSRMTTRNRTVLGGFKIEDVERLPIATSHGFAPWDYVSRPPYRVQLLDEHMRLDRFVSEAWPEIGGAVLRFAEIGLPMRPNSWCCVLDETFRVVLAYSTDTLAKAGPWGGQLWWGTAETFGVMNQMEVADGLDLAMWEAIATCRE